MRYLGASLGTVTLEEQSTANNALGVNFKLGAAEARQFWEHVFSECMHRRVDMRLSMLVV